MRGRRSDAYDGAVKRVREFYEVNRKEYENIRPKRCTRKKTCIPLKIFNWDNNSWCSGICWHRADMDIFALCFIQPGEITQFRFTVPEAKILSTLLTGTAAMFDMCLDPEYTKALDAMEVSE